MNQKKPTLQLRCMSIPYRQGFVEVTPDVHGNHLNIEAWNIHSDTELANVEWVADDQLTDDDVTANIELELTSEEARLLADSIYESLRRMKGD